MSGFSAKHRHVLQMEGRNNSVYKTHMTQRQVTMVLHKKTKTFVSEIKKKNPQQQWLLWMYNN